MSGFAYHGALAPLSGAVEALPGCVRFVDNLLDSGSITQPVLRKLIILARHVRFAFDVWGASASTKFFVREFSNVPLVFVFPLIRLARGRIRFLVNHNLQWTLSSRMERSAYTKLVKWGCRFVSFEQVPDHGLVPSGSALPHPVPGTAYKRPRGRGFATIGVIGQYRPEKGIDGLLDQLKPLAGDYRILLALPNLSVFRKASRFGNADWLSVRDTGGFDAYLQAIAECDVVVLNHPAEGYEYRASGLVADAAAAHVPVVVRNLPILCRQVSEPVCIGETFEALSEVPACIKRVAGRLGTDGYGFDGYIDGRTGKALETRLAEVMRL